MKRILTLTAILLCGLGLRAEISPKLAKEIHSRAAVEIYNAMDRFLEAVGPGWLTEVTYDCTPDGHKELTRRIEIALQHQHPVDRRKFLKAFKEFCQAYDAINPQGETVKTNTDSLNIVRAYKNGSEAAMAVLKDYQLTIAQTLTFQGPKPGANALLDCNRAFEVFCNGVIKKDGSRTVVFTAESKNSGVLRVRNNRNAEEVTEGIVARSGLHEGINLWEKAYALFMGYVGYDADISLTYKNMLNKGRMLTLYSPSAHVLNAATFKDYGCFLFNGGYRGNNPYLPSNWMYDLGDKK